MGVRVPENPKVGAQTGPTPVKWYPNPSIMLYLPSREAIQKPKNLGGDPTFLVPKLYPGNSTQTQLLALATRTHHSLNHTVEIW